MSAFGGKADIAWWQLNVGFVPQVAISRVVRRRKSKAVNLMARELVQRAPTR